MVVLVHQTGSKAEETAQTLRTQLEKEIEKMDAEEMSSYVIAADLSSAKSTSKVVEKLKKLILNLPTMSAEIPQLYSSFEQLLVEHAESSQFPCIDERTFVRIGTPHLSLFLMLHNFML